MISILGPSLPPNVRNRLSNQSLNWIIIQVTINGPMFEEVEDEDDSKHFIAFKWHSHSRKWLYVGGEVDARHFSCSARTLIWLLSADEGRDELLQWLCIPFGENHTMK